MTIPLRAGLFGVGSMGRHHARLLRGLAGVDLVVVVDRDGDRYGVADGIPVLPDPEGAIGMGLDIAVVAVPTAAHEALALRLAGAGVHVLVEKPLAPSIAACDALVSTFRRQGVVGAVGHVERFNPAIREMKRQIDAGAVGTVRRVATRRQGPFPARISDVGVGLDLASHDVDLTRWLTGSDYRSVVAQTWSAPDQANEGILDLLGTMSDGTLVSNAVNWHSALRERTVVVSGDDGVLVADTGASTLRLFPGSTGEGLALEVGTDEPLRSELEAFVDAVAGRSTSIASFADGAASVAVVQTAIGAAVAGTRADVPSMD